MTPESGATSSLLVIVTTDVSVLIGANGTHECMEY